MFYVYAHENPLTSKVFYIGKGSKHRATNRSGRGAAWNKVVRDLFSKGLSFGIRILHICDTEEKALELESLEINLHGKAGNDLVNFTFNGSTKRVLVYKPSAIYPDKRQRILDVLRVLGKKLYYPELYVNSGVRRKEFLKHLKELVGSGEVVRTGHGKKGDPFLYEYLPS